METKTQTHSHQILDKVDEIKHKLTDLEYKEIVELLQEKHKTDKKKDKKYNFDFSGNPDLDWYDDAGWLGYTIGRIGGVSIGSPIDRPKS